jgi:hypothetical protein
LPTRFGAPGVIARSAVRVGDPCFAVVGEAVSTMTVNV